ncbi:harmonin-binding protein USHBP1 isoform X1 [Pogona vitticeps]
MEKEGADPRDNGSLEKPPPLEEGAILRYEERIMDLLVTIARLHGRAEHLQKEKEAREDDEVSDFRSEYTASLPRYCFLPFPSPAVILASPPPPASLGERPPDLFLAVQEAVTSLENTVFSHRSRIPSIETELEGYIQATEGLEESLRKCQQGDHALLTGELNQESRMSGSGPPDFLAEDTSVYEREMALYKERNATLWLDLAGRKEELRKSKEMLRAYQEERDKLQRKIKELQISLSEVETLTDGAGERDPGAFRTGTPVLPQKPSPLEETHGPDPETQMEQLRGSIGALQSLNQLLSAALQESKSDTEQLSMLLGRQESDHTALRLAAHYSACCLEAYEELWGLTLAERGLSTLRAGEEGELLHAGASGPPCQETKSAAMDRACRALPGGPTHKEELLGAGGVRAEERGPGTAEKQDTLRGYIQRLRTEQAALKLPAPPRPPAPASVAARIRTAIGAKVVAVQRASRGTLPAAARTQTGPQRLQELQATREALGNLHTRLHLTEKEKQSLELPLYTYRAQEAAFRLMVRILEEERDELRGQGSPASASSSSSSSSSGNSDSEEYGPIGGVKRCVSGPANDPERTGPNRGPETQILELLNVLARNQELKAQIQSLFGELEERSHESQAQGVQQVELTRDFFKAHRALVLTYLDARKKQETQISRLETQMGLMGQRQAGQVESLKQILRGLEGGKDGRGDPPNGQPS